MSLENEINKRRTFGIISHPDAGKTTLTEKLLLFGGAIHVAGAVKAKKSTKHATSDFMEIEKQRGISVATSVMGFEYKDTKISLLDTPGHKDFSEDTYRTLTAVDSAIMVIDSTKGVEEQTHKLMEVCRMRNTPIMTFINKLDRDGKEPIELLDEIEEKLKIKVCPLSWPIGMGKLFKGVYNLHEKELVFFKPHAKQDSNDTIKFSDLSDPELETHIESAANQLREDVELVEGVYPEFDVQAYLDGKLTPVFFGSGLNNFGVKELLDCFIQYAPTPLPRETSEEIMPPDSPKFSGFIFKIHANMDPNHRDRIAFLRVCTGTFKRGAKLTNTRTQKLLKFSTPTAFMAQEKSIVDEAFPGDIIGLHDTGNLKIGDTLTEGAKFTYKGVPNFSPEIFKYVVNLDPMKSKQLQKGLEQLCEEGVAQLFTRQIDNRLIVGTVGVLQYEVIQYRLENEYRALCRFDNLNFIQACWITGKEEDLSEFIKSRGQYIALDSNDQYVYMAETKWSLDREIRENPAITFHFTSEF